MSGSHHAAVRRLLARHPGLSWGEACALAGQRAAEARRKRREREKAEAREAAKAEEARRQLERRGLW